MFRKECISSAYMPLFIFFCKNITVNLDLLDSVSITLYSHISFLINLAAVEVMHGAEEERCCAF